MQNGIKDGARSIAPERKNTGGHFVKHNSEENKSERPSNSLPKTCSGDM